MGRRTCVGYFASCRCLQASSAMHYYRLGSTPGWIAQSRIEHFGPMWGLQDEAGGTPDGCAALPTQLVWVHMRSPDGPAASPAACCRTRWRPGQGTFVLTRCRCLQPGRPAGMHRNAACVCSSMRDSPTNQAVIFSAVVTQQYIVLSSVPIIHDVSPDFAAVNVVASNKRTVRAEASRRTARPASPLHCRSSGPLAALL